MRPKKPVESPKPETTWDPSWACRVQRCKQGLLVKSMGCRSPQGPVKAHETPAVRWWGFWAKAKAMVCSSQVVIPFLRLPKVYSVMHSSSWSRWESVLKGARFIYGSMRLHLRDALCQCEMWTPQTGSVLYCLFILLPYQLPRAEESFLSGIIYFLTSEPEHLDHQCVWLLAARFPTTNMCLVPVVPGALLTTLEIVENTAQSLYFYVDEEAENNGKMIIDDRYCKCFLE